MTGPRFYLEGMERSLNWRWCLHNTVNVLKSLIFQRLLLCHVNFTSWNYSTTKSLALPAPGGVTSENWPNLSGPQCFSIHLSFMGGRRDSGDVCYSLGMPWAANTEPSGVFQATTHLVASRCLASPSGEPCGVTESPAPPVSGEWRASCPPATRASLLHCQRFWHLPGLRIPSNFPKDTVQDGTRARLYGGITGPQESTEVALPWDDRPSQLAGEEGGQWYSRLPS